MKRIGFIGLGNMGSPMINHLLKANYEVVGYDINNKFTKIGIGLSFQRINNLPTNIYDKKLSCIITEKNIIE